MFGIFKKKEKPRDVSTIAMNKSNGKEIIDSITERSIGGYLYEDLLSNRDQRPGMILGAEVIYLEKNDAYMKGASQQVQIQFSSLGHHISYEGIVDKTQGYNNLVHTTEFGQHDFLWSLNGCNCSISVHPQDDIFEITFWR